MIRSWLGHASIETTHGYVEIDLEMKRKTLQSCEPLEHPSGIGSGRITPTSSPEIFEINVKKGIDERFGKFFTFRDTLINKECIKQAVLGKSP